ncbi:MAG: DUF488 domain-containing protein [Candidatus Marsarchaeota archaeon]|nr:DUF488 domain-containing protein [Candidatus Marsarchaeota archaeon]
MKTAKQTVFTIGHSTRKLSDFIKILQAYGINELVDVRTIPRSRANPQFNGTRLKKALNGHHITYINMSGLGGLRHPKKDSINTAWRNASFRGFADYMQTKDFKTAIGKLKEIAKKKRIVIMCAEAVPWRCHRSLIGDALLLRKMDVVDIFSISNSRPHSITPWAKATGKKITYPGKRQQQELNK